jgi:uncharacterized protein YndB with AHSA1/START domain
MNSITISAIIKAPIDKVWKCWTKAEHITNWNFAGSDWHCPTATVDFKIGGEFHYKMSAKDNSMSFDFWGIYQNIEFEKCIEIILGDQRIWSVNFQEIGDEALITEIFEPEMENPIEMQQAGWQMILDNFKNYTEKNFGSCRDEI